MIVRPFMFLLLAKLNRKEAGFTLLETTVALFIITVAILPILILATISLNASLRIENNIIASNLAQEGIEIIRNIRDNNWINGLPFDEYLLPGNWRVHWYTIGPGIIPVDSNPVLKKNNGIYNYAAGVDTPYRRVITISKPNSSELVVTSTVTWVEKGINKSISVESHLYDWR